MQGPEFGTFVQGSAPWLGSNVAAEAQRRPRAGCWKPAAAASRSHGSCNPGTFRNAKSSEADVRWKSLSKAIPCVSSLTASARLPSLEYGDEQSAREDVETALAPGWPCTTHSPLHAQDEQMAHCPIRAGHHCNQPSTSQTKLSRQTGELAIA